MSHVNPHISHRVSERQVGQKPLSYYVDGITIKRDDVILSEAITLLESTQEDHKELAYQILASCFPKRNQKSIRIGVTGSPGVGKSTFIEYLGKQIIAEKKRIAILTIDPSSHIKKGSILGDKTRMNDLHQNANVFIRPSPSSTYLGGSHRYTSEAIWLCEAAGYDLVIVETVGVGQSEIEISDITDYNLLLIAPAAGDSLQGVKMGIMEVADMIVIHKADGAALSLAEEQRDSIKEALHTLSSDTEIVLHSSLYPDSKRAVWHTFLSAISTLPLHEKRDVQNKKWLQRRLHQYIVETASLQLEKHMSSQSGQIATLSESPIKAYLGLLNELSVSVKFAG